MMQEPWDLLVHARICKPTEQHSIAEHQNRCKLNSVMSSYVARKPTGEVWASERLDPITYYIPLVAEFQ